MKTSAAEDTYALGLRLWKEWTDMWNGRPELARELVADRFVLHLTVPLGVDPATIDSPAAVEAWVTGHRAKSQRLFFHNDCGPFVDVVAGVVAGPWYAETSNDGSTPPACGMDTIAFADGKVTEYWTLSKPVEAVGLWVTRQAAPPGR